MPPATISAPSTQADAQQEIVERVSGGRLLGERARRARVFESPSEPQHLRFVERHVFVVESRFLGSDLYPIRGRRARTRAIQPRTGR